MHIMYIVTYVLYHPDYNQAIQKIDRSCSLWPTRIYNDQIKLQSTTGQEMLATSTFKPENCTFVLAS